MQVTDYMPLEKRRILVKTFVEWQFNYYPLTQMLHSRTLKITIKLTIKLI